MNKELLNLLKQSLILGSIGTLGYYARTVPGQIIDTIKKRYMYQSTIDSTNDIMYREFSKWYEDTYGHTLKSVYVAIRRSDYYDKMLEDEFEDGAKFGLFRTPIKDFTWFKYKGVKIWMSKKKERPQGIGNNGVTTMAIETYVLSVFNNPTILRELEQELFDRFIQRQKNKKSNSIFLADKWTGFTQKEIESFKTFDKLFFQEKDSIMKYLEDFEASSETYKRLGVNMKKGILLYGPPGTGKTNIAMAASRYLKRDIYIINLSTVTDADLIQKMSQVPSGSIVLYEDIDCIFKKDVEDKGEEVGESESRELKEKVKISFSTLLNVLDGVYAPENVLVFMTTNHPEILEKAMIRRGRIDRKYYIGVPGKKEVNEFLSFFYEEQININYTGDFTISDIQEMCLSRNRQQVIEELTKIKE